MRASGQESLRDWVSELEASGWKRKTLGVWESPWGTLHRGPYGAWRAMQSIEQWGLKRCKDCGEFGAIEITHKQSCTQRDLGVEILKMGLLP